MKNYIKIITVFAFALLALCFVAPRSFMQTKVETAGQKFKNIKVLTDMPADQMGKVMNQFSASLGVNCKFCHASNDADFEKDGNEHKDIAREMIKMTFEINKSAFQGRPEVTCNTCHQGNGHPQSAINLYPAVREERPKQPETKPTIDAILSNYEKALGGKTALDGVSSREIKAQRVEADGKTTEDETVYQQAKKFAVRTDYVNKTGTYVVREVFDGTTVAKFGDGSPIELKADEAAQIQREAQLFANANLKSVYATIDYRAVDKIDGREVYLVTATNADKSRERLYFDVQTGFLVRRVSGTPTIFGMFGYQVDYLDYKDFGGVKLPSTIKFAVPNIRWQRKVLEVKNNVRIEDAKFAVK